MNREDVRVAQHIAAGIALEIRTPVFGIASAAQLIRYRIADDPALEMNVGRILRETERLNILISALLDYSRPAPLDLQPGDPDEVWNSVLQTQRGALESRALLVQHSRAEPRAACRLDLEQFGDACTNALTNAIEAAPEGGDLTIVSTTAANGAWTSQLNNSGSVVPEDLIARAFDPLVTTKPGHAGIGLAIAHRVLTDLGGSPTLESSATAGTTLTFVLPASLYS